MLSFGVLQKYLLKHFDWMDVCVWVCVHPKWIVLIFLIRWHFYSFICWLFQMNAVFFLHCLVFYTLSSLYPIWQNPNFLYFCTLARTHSLIRIHKERDAEMQRVRKWTPEKKSRERGAKLFGACLYLFFSSLLKSSCWMPSIRKVDKNATHSMAPFEYMPTENMKLLYI